MCLVSKLAYMCIGIVFGLKEEEVLMSTIDESGVYDAKQKKHKG